MIHVNLIVANIDPRDQPYIDGLYTMPDIVANKVLDITGSSNALLMLQGFPSFRKGTLDAFAGWAVNNLLRRDKAEAMLPRLSEDPTKLLNDGPHFQDVHTAWDIQSKLNPIDRALAHFATLSTWSGIFVSKLKKNGSELPRAIFAPAGFKVWLLGSGLIVRELIALSLAKSITEEPATFPGFLQWTCEHLKMHQTWWERRADRYVRSLKSLSGLAGSEITEICFIGSYEMTLAFAKKLRASAVSFKIHNLLPPGWSNPFDNWILAGQPQGETLEKAETSLRWLLWQYLRNEAKPWLSNLIFELTSAQLETWVRQVVATPSNGEETLSWRTFLWLAEEDLTSLLDVASTFQTSLNYQFDNATGPSLLDKV